MIDWEKMVNEEVLWKLDYLDSLRTGHVIKREEYKHTYAIVDERGADWDVNDDIIIVRILDKKPIPMKEEWVDITPITYFAPHSADRNATSIKLEGVDIGIVYDSSLSMVPGYKISLGPPGVYRVWEKR